MTTSTTSLQGSIEGCCKDLADLSDARGLFESVSKLEEDLNNLMRTADQEHEEAFREFGLSGGGGSGGGSAAEVMTVQSKIADLQRRKAQLEHDVLARQGRGKDLVEKIDLVRQEVGGFFRSLFLYGGIVYRSMCVGKEVNKF